jgi:hypothetical protein
MQIEEKKVETFSSSCPGKADRRVRFDRFQGKNGGLDNQGTRHVLDLQRSISSIQVASAPLSS